MDRMRIALVTAYFPPAPGGQELHVYELARGLARMGHEVTVVTSDLLGPAERGNSSYRLIELPSVRVGSDALPLGLARGLRDASPDVVHIHSPLMTISTLASLAAPGVPLVATYHGDYHKFTLSGNLLKRLRNSFQLPVALGRARTVIALTESDRRLLVSYGIDEGRVRVIHPGVDTGGLNGGDPSHDGRGEKVLYVGRIVYQKGISELIRSFRAVCEEREGVELVMAGDGDALDDMRELVRDQGLDARVSFRGWVRHDDLVRLYQEAAMVVLPSFSEGLPYALLEAMAAGRAVVASDVSGIRELVSHGENGLLFDLGDGDGLSGAILRLLRDPEERRRLGESGREIVMSRFSKERWLEQTVGVYEQAL